jgi:ferritin-like metal-binding protein YciE
MADFVRLTDESAAQLELAKAVKLIDETLKQEKAADQLLTKNAVSGVNTEARWTPRAAKAIRVTTTKPATSH